jgi:hypothetical protein
MVAIYAFMAAVLAAGWAFFYTQSSALPLGEIDAARSALSVLRAIDTRWNDRTRAGGRFDPAAYGHGRVYAELEVRGLRTNYPGLGLAVVGVRNAFQEKADALREGRLEQVWLAPTGPRMDAMSRTLDRAFDDALMWAELYRAWLLYYSLFLVTVCAYVMWRLREARAAS